MQAEQNDLITRIGPGTPCGALMRQLLAAGGAARRVRPAPRSAHGAPAGQGGAPARAGPRAVPRRPRPLGPARPAVPAPRRRPRLRPLEDDGLRCPFHGWKFDATGACLETPAEPAGTTLCTRVRQRSYPVREQRGILFAWLGPEGSTPPRAAGVRLLRRAGQPQLRLQGPVALQLAAGVRGRHRPGASLVPAPLPAGRGSMDDGLRARSSAPPAPARRRRALADDARDARVPPARDPLRGDRRTACCAHHAAADDPTLTHVRVTHAGLPADLRDPAAPRRSRSRRCTCRSTTRTPTGTLLHQLRRAARQGGDAQPAPGLHHAARLRAEERPPQRLGLQPRGAAHRAPTSAWARTTSTCTTSGRSRAWARSRTARASTWAPATR